MIYTNTKTKCGPLFLASNLHASVRFGTETWKICRSCHDRGVATSRFCVCVCVFFYPIWISKYWWVWVSFLDVNHLIWYSFCYILVSWCILIRFQSGWVQLLNKFDCLLWESCSLVQLILFGFQIMILVWCNFFGVFLVF